MKNFKYSISKKKSEIEIKTLIVIILAAISLILLGSLIYTWYSSAKQKLEVQDCVDSIRAHDFISTTTVRQIFTDIKCPTKQVTFGSSNDNEVKNAIASDMQTCWYEWGRGGGEYFPGDGTFCYVCAIYDFKDKSRKIPGFMQYLTTEKIHLSYPGDDKSLTYLQYFSPTYKNTPPQTLVDQMNKVNLAASDYIDTSQKYATIFVYSSDKTAMEKIMEGGVRVVTGSAGLLSIKLGILGGFGGTVAVATLGSNPVGWAITGAGLVALGGVAVWESLNIQQPKSISLITFKPYTSSEIEGIPCQKMEVNQLSNQK